MSAIKEVMQGLIGYIGSAASIIFTNLLAMVQNNLGFGDAFIINNVFTSVDYMAKLLYILNLIGMIAATGIFVFCLITALLGPLSKQKESSSYLIVLFIRFFIVTLMIMPVNTFSFQIGSHSANSAHGYNAHLGKTNIPYSIISACKEIYDFNESDKTLKQSEVTKIASNNMDNWSSISENFAEDAMEGMRNWYGISTQSKNTSQTDVRSLVHKYAQSYPVTYEVQGTASSYAANQQVTKVNVPEEHLYQAFMNDLTVGELGACYGYSPINRDQFDAFMNAISKDPDANNEKENIKQYWENESKVLDTGGIAYAIVTLVFLIGLCIEMIKFVASIVKHYIMMYVHVWFHPVAASTLVSSATSRVYFSYLVTFITHLLLVIVSVMFGKMIQIGFSSIGPHDLFGVIFMISLVQVLTEFGNTLNAWGMSYVKSSGGGGILAAGGAALGALGAMVAWGGGGIRLGRAVAGTGLSGTGHLAGMPSLVSAGSKVGNGRGMSTVEAMKQMNGSPFSHVTDKGAKQAMTSAIRHGDFTGMTAFNALNSKSKAAAFESYTGMKMDQFNSSVLGGYGAVDPNSITFGRDGSCMFTSKGFNEFEGAKVNSFDANFKLKPNSLDANGMSFEDSPMAGLGIAHVDNTMASGIEYACNAQVASSLMGVKIEDCNAISVDSEGFMRAYDHTKTPVAAMKNGNIYTGSSAFFNGRTELEMTNDIRSMFPDTGAMISSINAEKQELTFDTYDSKRVSLFDVVSHPDMKAPIQKTDLGSFFVVERKLS